MAYCRNCGTQIVNNARKCAHCGTPIKKERKINSFLVILLVFFIVIIYGVMLIGLLGRKSSERGYRPSETTSESVAVKERPPDVVNEILGFVKEYDRLVKKDDLIEVVRLFSKPYREYFNSRSLQERLLILASMKMWGGGFTDCKTTVRSVNFQDSERTSGRVLVYYVCKNPSTGKTVEQETTIPVVKEEDGWKLDMIRFMQDFDEKLKAR